MTAKQKEILILAVEDIKNGVNTDWAEAVVRLILDNVATVEEE